MINPTLMKVNILLYSKMKQPDSIELLSIQDCKLVILILDAIQIPRLMKKQDAHQMIVHLRFLICQIEFRYSLIIFFIIFYMNNKTYSSFKNKISVSPKQVKPVYRINVKLNLPKIRKEQEQFQTLIDSYDSDNNSVLHTRSMRSWSKYSSKEKEKLPAEYILYGFSRMKTSRNKFFQQTNQNSFIEQECFDRTDAEWLEYCLTKTPPHAKVKFYNKLLNVSEWEEVEILDYNYEYKKFIVQKYPNGQRKRALRKDIRFFDQEQNDNKLQQDIKKNQQRQLYQQAQIKNQSTINNIKDQQVQGLPQKIKEGLIQKYKFSRDKELIKNLVSEIDQFYKFAMKKCILNQELTVPKHKWKNTIKNNYFNETLLKIQKEALHLGILTHNCLQSFVIRCSQFNFKLVEYSLIRKYHNIQPKSKMVQNNIQNKSNIVYLELENQNWTQKMEKEYHMHLLYIVSEIQDYLNPRYNLFQSDIEQYQGSALQKIVTRMDCQFNTFFYDYIIDFIRRMYLYYNQFTNDKFIKVNQGNKKLSLVYIQGTITQKIGGLKRVSEKDEGNKNKNQIITITPSLDQIQKVLMDPINKIKQICFNQPKLRHQILQLLDINRDIILNEDQIVQIEQEEIKINMLINNEFQLCQEIMQKFDIFLPYIKVLKQKDLSNLFGVDLRDKILISQIQIDTIQEYLSELYYKTYQVQRIHANDNKIGLFTLQLQDLKQSIIKCIKFNIEQINSKIIEIVKLTLNNLEEEYQQMYNIAKKIPLNEEEFISLKLFLDQVIIQLSTYNLDMLNLEQLFDLLSDIFCLLDPEIYSDYLALLKWPQLIMEQVEKNKENVKQQEQYFLKKLQQNKLEFIDYYLSIQHLAAEIKSYNNYQQLIKETEKSQILTEMLNDAEEQIIKFQRSENIFQLPVTHYPEITMLQNDVKDYQQLWNLIQDYEYSRQQWLSTTINKLDYQIILSKLQSFINTSIEIEHKFIEIYADNAQSLIRGFRSTIDEFKDKLWVVKYLAIEAFDQKSQLWRDFIKESKLLINDSYEDCLLSTIFDKGIFTVKDLLIEFSLKAEKQWNIEKRVNEMQAKVSLLQIEFSPYQDTFLITAYEDILSQFDEQSNFLNMIKNQTQVKSILSKVNQLEQKIMLIVDTIELGLKCQKFWLYLDPIFSSDDVQTNLKVESRNFRIVDLTFKQNMQYLYENKDLWTSIDNERLKLSFQTNVSSLELIFTNLNEYLEEKRVIFPRFYFISNDELVEILAISRQPSILQNYISKCFNGISSLKYTAENTTIQGVISQHKEVLQLVHWIEMKTNKRPGKVEQWLQDIMISIQKTIKTKISKTLQDIKSPVKELILKQPCQCVMVAYQIDWTQQIELILKSNAKDRYIDFLNHQQSILYEAVKIIREKDSKQMNQLALINLETLVLQQVHLNDIILELQKKDVDDSNDFNWVVQIRFYSDQNNITIKTINTSIQYGYEYIGQFTKLVITPLTLRCYRTLLQALSLNYGCAPEGPAGTGKTETIKDISKTLGYPCQVINCSEGINYQNLTCLLKGVVQSGVWCCFDEFNRIFPEVLSVAAQQLYSIFQALKQQETQLIFEGTKIKLINTFSINITMNPGYIGRTELPDNLKVLFRPCTMILPDYLKITEIYLYSIGFEKAQELSLKIYICYKICSEQLSNQIHYDFGMRALKAALTSLKNGNLNESEQLRVVNAVISNNLSKCVGTDYDLFMQIIQDVFPDVESTYTTYSAFNFKQNCEELNYSIDDNQLSKCQQLYDNIQIRNGVVNLGVPYSGKTVALKILTKTIESVVYKLNPKALSTTQMYGMLDPYTSQWQEGVLSNLVRQQLNQRRSSTIQQQQNEKPQNRQILIIFDGPIDSQWVENLNSVLDDNKKMFLSSGETLQIPEEMVFLFEVEDLKAASPATISRCGMVYYEQLNWQILLHKFDVESELLKKIQFLIKHTIRWTNTNIKQFLLYNCEIVFVSHFMKLFQHFKNIYQESENIDNYLIFCIVWSFGAGLEDQQKYQFNQFLIQLFQLNSKLQFTKLKQLNYFTHIFHENNWIEWIKYEPQKIHENTVFNDLIIQTNDSIRNTYFANLGINFLFCGPTSTGKTQALGEVSQLQINCTSQTDSNSIQKLIESKVHKRLRKGVYQSENGHINIFIDDIHLCQIDRYGSQPAIELLRQWLEFEGWYDLENKEFKLMHNITLLVAMQPPNGVRQQISNRFIRYLNFIYISTLSQESIYQILNGMINLIINRQNLKQEIIDLTTLLIQQSIEIFTNVQNKLLPTPLTSHYIYNFRDLLKVFIGIGKVTKIETSVYLIQLWIHENQRIYCDRLVNEDDKCQFNLILKESLQKFKYSITNFQSYLWLPFIERRYEQANSLEQVKDRLQYIIEEYNNINSSQKCNMILFDDAILQIVHISRALYMQNAHILLIGMGGSGRLSVSKLATFIMLNKQAQQIDNRNWDEQLYDLVISVGLEKQRQVLILNDSTFSKEYMLEDICTLISHGDVPHLFPPEERHHIQQNMKYQEFSKNCKLYLHIILCMQPIGELYKKRLRLFPQLIHYTNVIWFAGWPDEALEQVGNQYLSSQQLVNIAINSYHFIQQINYRYQQELRRFFYVTPTQYLQMVTTYNQLVNQKTEQARREIDKFDNGVEKLIETEVAVDKIRNQLFELQPQLEKANIESLKLLNNIKKKQEEANENRKICEIEEIEYNQKRQMANELRDICQTQLNTVLPLLTKATEALDKISKDDMTLLKTFTNPPPSVVVVMQGLLYAMQEDDKVQAKNKQPLTPNDFWDYAKKHLLNEKLIRRIKKMKLEQIRAINVENIKKLKIFILNPLFEREKVFNASSAAGNLAEWIRAVLSTYEAVEIIEPKKELLRDAEQKLQQAEEEVKIKKIALDQAEIILERFSNEYNKAKQEKDIIEQKVHSIQAQLNRAERLIYGLGEEKQRWIKKGQQLKRERHCIQGDCLLAASIISYFGIFPVNYREECILHWKKLFRQNNVGFNEDYSLSKHLSDPITINKWIQNKLPNDQMSIENAIILKQSIKWPLMIDPQLQANQWIKSLEHDNQLLVINSKQQAQQIETSLEHALQLGFPVLLENVQEIIDPLFEQILQFQITKHANDTVIKFGDKVLEYCRDFRIYLTTIIQNPHFTPQVCLMVTMLNFQVTLEGLTDQMINIIAKIDEPHKEVQRINNIQSFFQNKNQQQQRQEQILQLLSESVGNLLEDEILIQTLQKSKEEGQEIEERLKKLSIDATLFNQTREYYRKAAYQISKLYFVIYNMSLIEPTYQWSLDFFISLYKKSIKEATVTKQKRIQSLVEKFNYNLYIAINRSLLEKDKFIFRFLFTSRIMEIPIDLIRYCLIGEEVQEREIKNEISDYQWLNTDMQQKIIKLEQNFPKIFNGLSNDLKSNKSFWNNYFQNQVAYKIKIMNFEIFPSLMVLKIIKPEQFILGVNDMIKTNLGEEFIENIPQNLERNYQESNAYTPFLCVVTAGADPLQDIMQLSKVLHFEHKFHQLSLGQGQGQVAFKLIRQAMEKGQWVLLQNCHVAESFMSELDKFYEQTLTQEVHQDFRLFLTTLPSNSIPLNIILKSLKMAYELPRGIKNIMLKAQLQENEDFLNNTNKQDLIKHLCFQLTLFHACILERRKYGSLGWNIQYNFTFHDLQVSKEIIKQFIENYSEIQWNAIKYLITETIYGGRITDDMDQRLLNVMLDDFLNPQTINQNQLGNPHYHNYNSSTFITQIHGVPLNDGAEIFGLHQNAEVYSAILETSNLSKVLVQLLPRNVETVENKNNHPDKKVKEKCKELLLLIPKLVTKSEFDLQDSLQVFVNSEMQRYKQLIIQIDESLNQLIQVLNGQQYINDELLNLYYQIQNDQLPQKWLSKSYPSTKQLSSYIFNLRDRIKYIQQLQKEQINQIYWMGGFYHPVGFLTAQLQIHSKITNIPIDQLIFDNQFYESQEQDTSDQGFLVKNIYIEGAQFDFNTYSLQDPQLNRLSYECPLLQFWPTNKIRDYNYYQCPLYRTQQRDCNPGAQNSNFISQIYVPIQQSQSYWIKRGVAMVLEIN